MSLTNYPKGYKIKFGFSKVKSYLCIADGNSAIAF